MIPKRLQEMLDFAEDTDLQELSWEKNGVSVSFHRGASSVKKHAVASAALTPTAAGNASEAAPKVPEPVTIRSTMVGTFYRADSPNRPPLVVEGTVVATGQPVAAIEAMKIMKDVVAPVSCRIVKALVANGHPVEYGQPLFEIENV